MIQVSAAILEKDGKVLLARRAKGQAMEGLWEFPGGKLEPGESLKSCLERELLEELGVVVEAGEELGRNVHSYERGVIELVALRVRHLSGEFMLRDHDAIAWVERARLLDYELAPADIPIAASLAADRTGR